MKPLTLGEIKLHKQSIVKTIITILLVILTAWIFGGFDSEATKIKKIISNQDNLSKQEIENTIINIKETENQINILKENSRLLQRCKTYNENRIGTINSFKQCDLDTLNKNDKIITKEVSKTSKGQINPILVNLNLSDCRVTQGEVTHMQTGGGVYATDIACIKGKSFEVYASNNFDRYVVASVGKDKLLGDYITLKHSNNTYLYGHTKTELKVGDRVDKNTKIGKTNMSGMSSGIHLHFEIWKDGNNVSSKGIVNPKNYSLKKQRGLIKNHLKQNIKRLLLSKSRTEDYNKNRYGRVATKYGIKEEMLVCVSYIETHLGTKLKSANNFGNIGNRDRGDTVSYSTEIEGISAIARQLTQGTYLKGNKTIGDLSSDGGTTSTKRYATDSNWINNLKDCIGKLREETLKNDFTYKI